MAHGVRVGGFNWDMGRGVGCNLFLFGAWLWSSNTSIIYLYLSRWTSSSSYWPKGTSLALSLNTFPRSCTAFIFTSDEICLTSYLHKSNLYIHRMSLKIDLLNLPLIWQSREEISTFELLVTWLNLCFITTYICLNFQCKM